MGTTYTVKVISPQLNDQRLFEIRQAIESELEIVDSKMSTYRADSELSRFNESRATEPFTVSRETFEVFQRAQEISSKTGGAFDITVGPLVNAWGFGPGAEAPQSPGEDDLAEIRRHVGWRKIELDPAAVTIRKLEPEVECDLSAIAKGYAADRVSSALSKLGLSDHMVEIGGDVRTSGRNQQGIPWQIAVERPEEGKRALHRLVALQDAALATSGDYRNFYEQDGVRYSHTIDPSTGSPVRHRLASVSVMDALCVVADGYATALMVLGESEGYNLAVEQNLAALFLVRDADGTFIEKTTPAFDARFGRE